MLTFFHGRICTIIEIFAKLQSKEITYDGTRAYNSIQTCLVSLSQKQKSESQKKRHKCFFSVDGCYKFQFNC